MEASHYPYYNAERQARKTVNTNFSLWFNPTAGIEPESTVSFFFQTPTNFLGVIFLFIFYSTLQFSFLEALVFPLKNL